MVGIEIVPVCFERKLLHDVLVLCTSMELVTMSLFCCMHVESEHIRMVLSREIFRALKGDLERK